MFQKNERLYESTSRSQPSQRGNFGRTVEHFTRVLTGDGVRRRAALQWAEWLADVYQPVNFHGAKVLDVGAGTGLHSLFAAYAGARRVVALEPVSAGAHSDTLRVLRRRVAMMENATIEISGDSVQSFCSEEKFDIIICFNAINHFQEKLVSLLPHNNQARDYFRSVFARFASLLSQTGRLVLADVSPRNKLRLLTKIPYIRHPFAPTINWQIHQPPEVWSDVAGDVGFVQKELKWSVPRQIMSFHALLSNRLASSFLTSHFILVLQRDK